MVGADDNLAHEGGQLDLPEIRRAKRCPDVKSGRLENRQAGFDALADDQHGIAGCEPDRAATHAPERHLVRLRFCLCGAFRLQIGAMHSNGSAVVIFDRTNHRWQRCAALVLEPWMESNGCWNREPDADARQSPG